MNKNKPSLAKVFLPRILVFYLFFVLIFYSNKILFYGLAGNASKSNIATTNYISRLLDKDRDHNILILLANNAEIRFGGGFIGSVGVIKVENGKISADPVRSVYYYDHRIEGDDMSSSIEPVPYIKGMISKLFLRDTGMYQDFSENAKLARYFFEKEGGVVADDVISFTPELMLELLRYTGPVYIKNYDMTVSADNFRSVVQLEVEGGKDKAANQDPKSILSHLANAVFEKALQLDMADYSKLDKAFASLSQRKQIMAYSTDNNTMDIIKSLGIDGNQNILEGNYWSLIEANIGADKSSPFMKKKITQDISVQDNMLDINMTISISHTSDFAHLYYEPRDKKERYMIQNNVSYYNLTLPAQSVVVSSSIDNPTIDTGSSKTDIGFYLTMVPLSQTELKLHYKVPFDASNHSLLSYYEKPNGSFPVDYELNFKTKDVVNLITTNYKDKFNIVKYGDIYKVKSSNIDTDFYLNLSW